MLFKVAVKNFGKLTDKIIHIGKFTVFAGPNNTGKSFVSKALYSIFNGMNANHLIMVFDKPMRNLLSNLRRMERQEGFAGTSLKLMMEEIFRLRDTIVGVPRGADVDELGGIDRVLPDIRRHVDDIKKISVALKAECESFINSAATAADDIVWINDRTINRMEQCVAEIFFMRERPGIDLFLDGLHGEIRENFFKNFQIGNLHDLCGTEGEFEFDIEDVGTIRGGGDGDGINFRLAQSGIDQLQQYSGVLYVESPVFSRLRRPLVNIEKLPPRFFLDPREQLTSVPKYFYDLEQALNTSYVGDIAFPEILAKLTGGDMLGGKVKRGETGDLFFQEQDREYPLHLAAMGVANLGMLALLIEKNILDTDTFLFIDEPEAHLHPAWQVEMAKALFALAEGGVNVVIATHSPDILKWLEVQLKESPESGEQVALNHFRADGGNPNGGDVREKLDAIQEELAHPYYQLYYRGI